MNLKRVLILGVSTVQMEAIVELKKMGVETFACAKAKDGPGAEVADHFEIIDILDINKISNYIIKNNIDVVYSVGSDLAMPIIGKLSEDLHLPHFVSSSIAKICNNKDLMRITLGDDCKGNVPFQILDSSSIIPKMNFPYIMKPSDSQGQRGIILVNSHQEFKQNFNVVKSFSRSGKIILEKYIDGPELSVNGYIVNGNLDFFVVSERVTWPQHTGLIHKHIVSSTNQSIGDTNILKEIVEHSCKRIGIENGPVYFQIKIENGTPYIIEMTPRLDGCHMWKLIEYYSGVNLLRLALNHLVYGDCTELKKQIISEKSFELEFFCKEPNTKMNQNDFVVPNDAIDSLFYYNNLDIIRPINGKFEKVGYFIREIIK